MKVENSELLWAKTKENAIIPTKRNEDAGYDIYPCFEDDYMIIPSHKTKMIPTGVASAFSDDYVAILKERGSTGTKGIAQRCGCIDSGFRGEWMVPITNTTNRDLIITNLSFDELRTRYGTKDEDNCIYLKDGKDRIYLDFGNYSDENDDEDLPFIYPYTKAICQALILPVPKMKSNEVTYEDLKRVKSERGSGLLGSSGK